VSSGEPTIQSNEDHTNIKTNINKNNNNNNSNNSIDRSIERERERRSSPVLKVSSMISEKSDIISKKKKSSNAPKIEKFFSKEKESFTPRPAAALHFNNAPISDLPTSFPTLPPPPPPPPPAQSSSSTGYSAFRSPISSNMSQLFRAPEAPSPRFSSLSQPLCFGASPAGLATLKSIQPQQNQLFSPSQGGLFGSSIRPSSGNFSGFGFAASNSSHQSFGSASNDGSAAFGWRTETDFPLQSTSRMVGSESSVRSKKRQSKTISQVLTDQSMEIDEYSFRIETNNDLKSFFAIFLQKKIQQKTNLDFYANTKSNNEALRNILVSNSRLNKVRHFLLYYL
jgi:hypothetical protein